MLCTSTPCTGTTQQQSNRALDPCKGLYENNCKNISIPQNIIDKYPYMIKKSNLESKE